MAAGGICEHLHARWVGSPIQVGQVHSVFRRVANLSFTDGALVALLAPGVPRKPMAVAIQPGREIFPATGWIGLELKQSQTILFRNGRLEIPAAKLAVDLHGTEIFHSRPELTFLPASREVVEKRLAILRMGLAQANTAGLLPLLSLLDGLQDPPPGLHRCAQFAWPRLLGLIAAVKGLEWEQVTAFSRLLTGLGPGLTPSGDDLLIGWMAAAHYCAYAWGWPAGWVEPLNTAILAGAEGRTNPLSFQMLSFAARGEVTGDIHGVLRGIFAAKDELHSHLVEAVLRYGETSGADLLTGIVLGCQTGLQMSLTETLEDMII